MPITCSHISIRHGTWCMVHYLSLELKLVYIKAYLSQLLEKKNTIPITSSTKAILILRNCQDFGWLGFFGNFVILPLYQVDLIFYKTLNLLQLLAFNKPSIMAPRFSRPPTQRRPPTNPTRPPIQPRTTYPVQPQGPYNPNPCTQPR
jgi:hypothetical protein